MKKVNNFYNSFIKFIDLLTLAFLFFLILYFFSKFNYHFLLNKFFLFDLFPSVSTKNIFSIWNYINLNSFWKWKWEWYEEIVAREFIEYAHQADENQKLEYKKLVVKYNAALKRVSDVKEEIATKYYLLGKIPMTDIFGDIFCFLVAYFSWKLFDTIRCWWRPSITWNRSVKKYKLRLIEIYQKYNHPKASENEKDYLELCLVCINTLEYWEKTPAFSLKTRKQQAAIINAFKDFINMGLRQNKIDLLPELAEFVVLSAGMVRNREEYKIHRLKHIAKYPNYYINVKRITDKDLEDTY